MIATVWKMYHVENSFMSQKIQNVSTEHIHIQRERFKTALCSAGNSLFTTHVHDLHQCHIFNSLFSPFRLKVISDVFCCQNKDININV